MSVRDKVVVVTGGGSGIGRATAERLGREGAKVVIGNRKADQGEEVVAAIRAAGGIALFHQTDVTVIDQVETLVERALREFGRLDLAFNNAGYEGQGGPLHEHDPADAARLIDVNIKGVFYAMQAEIRAMRANGGGAIVNNSSILGLKGVPGLALYVATKHAVTGLTRGAALDYAKHGIRINAVGPGPIETRMLADITGGNPQSFGSFVPMGRIGQADEVARAVVWLLSDDASFLTGHTLPVDGGMNAA